MLTADEVRSLAREGRVTKDSRYHARQHPIRFDTIVGVLIRCFTVRPDERLDSNGTRLHPDGYVAWGRHWSGQVYRVDFNMGVAGDGKPVLLVVTAMLLED